MSLKKLGESKKGKGKGSKGKKKRKKVRENEPGPSHIILAYDSTDIESDMESEILENEKCCVCNKFTPDEVRSSISVIFTKWVECNNRKCLHLTHLKYFSFRCFIVVC